MKRQKIELGEDGFTIRRTAKCSLKFGRLRGYSFIYLQGGGIVHRLLVLYPSIGSGQFFIGIPRSVTDDAVRRGLDLDVAVVTITDERALTIT